MGMFDSVLLPCPKCYEQIELQSKAGKCAGEVFDSWRVPIKIAEDLSVNPIECSECHRSFEIVSEAPRYTSIRLVQLYSPKIEDEEEPEDIAVSPSPTLAQLIASESED